MKYTVHTLLGQLIKDKQARNIMERHIPGSTSHPQLHMALHMTLIEISQYPQAKLTEETLQALLADLNNGQGLVKE